MEWATFHGSADKENEIYKLSGVDGNGTFTLPESAVAFEHGKISVKIGATANLIEEPLRPVDAVGFESKEGCLRTCAIGLVEICCEDGRIVGACQARS